MRTAVVLDPHPLWLDAVERVLTLSGFTVVGRATRASDALGLIEEHAPDLLVAEIGSAPEADRYSVIRVARDRVPSIRVLVLSGGDEPETVRGALAAGAVAYVVKTADPEDLALAVRHSFQPSIFLPGQPAHSAPADASKSDVAHELTKRELEILRLAADGLSNGQLARRLWVTEQTVKFHLSNVYRKLGVSNRTEASRWAQVNGLLSGVEPAESGAESPTLRL